MKSIGILNEITVAPNTGTTVSYPVDVHGSILALLPDSSDREEEIEFLIKVFNASNKELGKDVLIWSIPGNVQLSFPDLQQHIHFSDLYLFGVEPAQIGLQSTLPLGVPVHLGEIFICRTDLPLKVQNTEEIKRPFWEILKKRYVDVNPE